ncbi:MULTISPECIES: hypothetical protein [unclassified Microcoleus]|nr:MULTISPECIES: hypothetical protein [unclassified Microcoleus]
MKIRLFITPILFLLGRDPLKLSTVNCQLSTVEPLTDYHKKLV